VLYREVMIVYCSSHNGHVNILSEQSAGLSVLNLAIGNNGVNFLRRLDLQGGGGHDDTLRLHVVEIARVPGMLPSLFLS